MTMDPDEMKRAIGPQTGAVCPVSVFGLPPDLDTIENECSKRGIPIICDSAQGLGSTYRNRPAGGGGKAEVFSLSPTKVVTSIEGGAITTNDSAFAERLRSMRDYGKAEQGLEMIYNGLSARMSELHGAVGLLSLRNVDRLVGSRLRLVQRYRDFAESLSGCSVQEFPDDRTANGNYFTLLVGNDAKLDRDGTLQALQRQGIQSKPYFHPPVHSQKALRANPHRIVGELPNTWRASKQSLALPLYAHMTDEQQEIVFSALTSLLG
jgi:dTDP-4-amino-4,6-dideoxygalactose transaminase